MDSTDAPAAVAARPKAVLFDVYGTLLDVYSVGLRAEQMFPGEGEKLARAWRDKQIEYSRLVSMSGRYRPFWKITRDALEFCAGTRRAPLGTASRRCGATAPAARSSAWASRPRASGARCATSSNSSDRRHEVVPRLFPSWSFAMSLTLPAGMQID